MVYVDSRYERIVAQIVLAEFFQHLSRNQLAKGSFEAVFAFYYNFFTHAECGFKAFAAGSPQPFGGVCFFQL